MRENSTLIKNSTIYALGDILPKLLSFMVFPLLTVYLSPADYGIISYINTLNAFLTVISFLCLNTYYLVYYFRVGNTEDQKKLLGNLSIFIMIFNVIIFIFMMFCGKYIFASLGSKIDFFPYIVIGVLINFFNTLSILPSALYRVMERPLPLTILNVLRGVLITISTVVMVLFLDYKVLGVLYANLFVAILFGFIFLRITWKNVIWKIDYKQIKQALFFSLPLLPGALAYYVVSISDRILIERYLDLTQLGIYSTASTLALILNIISYGAYKAFEPYFFKNYEHPSFNQKFEKIHSNYLFVILIIALNIALFSREFFQLFSSESYHVAYFYVPFILIGVIFASLLMMYATIITARNKTKINSLVTIVGGVVSVFLNMLFLSYYGIIVACFSSAISMIIMLSISYFYSQIRIDLKRPLFAFFMIGIMVWIFVYILIIPSIYISIFIKIILSFLMLMLTSKILKVRAFEVVLALFWRQKSVV